MVTMRPMITRLAPSVAVAAGSPDGQAGVAAYDRGWFEEVLPTVQLRPEDAVDPGSSPSP
jgi:hypothetical protein